jgi:hypothetical protein
MSICRAVVLCVGVVLAAAPTRSAEARGPKEQAERLLRAGNALHDRGRYEEALRTYRRAMAVYPSFKLHFNIGLTLSAMGQLAAAAESFEQFLALARDGVEPQVRTEVEDSLARLRRRLGLLVITARASAAISVDGGPASTSPVRLYLLPGRHRITVEEQDRRVERQVQLQAGDSRRVDLRPSAVEPRVWTPPVEHRPAPHRAPPPFYKRWWFWTVVGAVAVGATVGCVLGARAAAQDHLPSGELPDLP